MLNRRDKYAIEGKKPLKQDPVERLTNFDEVSYPYTPEMAMEQASRCLLCEHAPCSRGCPLHNDIPGAMELIAQGDFVGAAQRFLETSNLPDVCGRICPQEKQCEGSCVIGARKMPVNIGKLEAFVIDYVRKNFGYPPRKKEPPTGMKVAIVGAGPAGLAVAEELAVKGHEVVVYDAWPYPGGLLLYGIPGFKLNKDIVYVKIQYLEEMGIKFICNTRVGTDVSVEELLKEHDLVFLGYGAVKGGEMKIPGEDTLTHVYQATEYLVRGNLPRELQPKWWLNDGQDFRPHCTGVTVVIGGGDTAMDCVRTARRLNPAADVYCMYRRTEAEMPGRYEERVNARDEGVKFEWLTAPVKLIGDETGNVVAAECIRMKLGKPDEKGRRSPVPIEGSNFQVKCDTVVLAIGYSPETDIPAGTRNLKTTKWGTIIVDSEDTGATSREDVFAAGDNVRGADLVVTAVAAARNAAKTMHNKLITIKANREKAVAS